MFFLITSRRCAKHQYISIVTVSILACWSFAGSTKPSNSFRLPCSPLWFILDHQLLCFLSKRCSYFSCNRVQLFWPLKASTEWKWFGQFGSFVSSRLVKSLPVWRCPLWEFNDDSLSEPLSAETVYFLLSLARHACIYQESRSLLLKHSEVWPTFQVWHFQNPYSGFSLH